MPSDNFLNFFLLLYFLFKMIGVLRQKGAIKCNRSYNSLFLTDLEFSQEICECVYFNASA